MRDGGITTRYKWSNLVKDMHIHGTDNYAPSRITLVAVVVGEEVDIEPHAPDNDKLVDSSKSLQKQMYS